MENPRWRINARDVSKWDYHVCLFSVMSEPQTPAQPLDYNFAREEFMLNELSNDPIQTAIAKMEKQHEEDKQGNFTRLFFVHVPPLPPSEPFHATLQLIRGKTGEKGERFRMGERGSLDDDMAYAKSGKGEKAGVTV